MRLVVSRYKENLDWITELPLFDAIVIYDKENETIKSRISPYFCCDKDGYFPAIEILPNIGREVHTFLWHMTQYGVTEPTLFVQGHPFDHITREQLIEKIGTYTEGFCDLGENWHYCDMNGFPHHPGLPIGSFLRDMGMSLSEIKFIPGGQFIVDREPPNLDKIIETCDKYPEYPWIMERLWRYVF